LNASSRVLCWEFYILPLHSQYIQSLMLFVVKNMEEITCNTEVHTINTRHRSDLHLPSITWTKYQKVVYYSDVSIFNYLTQNIKRLSSNVKSFK